MDLACCAAVRNCGKYLQKIFDNLNNLSKEKGIKNFYVVFVYDNCNDNTGELLTNFAKLANYKVIVEHIENTHLFRTQRISIARNKCLLLLNSMHTDYHIMFDADDKNIDVWNTKLIMEHIKTQKKNSWDALSFNRKVYYDMWALMYDNYKYHCWGFGDKSAYVVRFLHKDITNKLKRNKFVEVDSAFNGFGIYKTDKFKGIFYSGYLDELNFLIGQVDIERSLYYFQKSINLKLKIEEKAYFRYANEVCEHLYYHLVAKTLHNTRIFISSDSIYL